MSSKNKGPLDEPTLRHIATHSVANSRALLEEAELLHDAGRWARAGALAVLAVEESGKAYLCHVVAFHSLPLMDDSLDPDVWQVFWDAFTDHPGKIDLWLSRVSGGRCGEYGAWMHEASTAHLSKLACLYVDYVLPEGAVTSPDLITEDESRQFMELGREASAWWDRVGWGADA